MEESGGLHFNVVDGRGDRRVVRGVISGKRGIIGLAGGGGAGAVLVDFAVCHFVEHFSVAAVREGGGLVVAWADFSVLCQVVLVFLDGDVWDALLF